MAAVLGISAYFHDSSACLVVDGEIIAAVCEERFTRKKHDASFPEMAIRYCLECANLTSEELDFVVFHEKPFTKFERILDTLLKKAPRGFRPFVRAIDSWLREKFWIEDTFRRTFPFKGEFSYFQHHLSHAATAAYSSPFDDAAYVIIDGVGERACTSIGRFEAGKLIPEIEQRFPHSIGLLYSAFTQYCGFMVNSGEYKLMGLAPYGEAVYTDLIMEKFVEQSADGSIRLKLNRFGFLDDLKMINGQFEQAFGQPARGEEEEMSQFYKDVAASIQKVTEELVLGVLNAAFVRTGKRKLVYGGGVALNCVINAEIIQRTSFEEVYIHSASGDSGCAYGAALWRAQQVDKQHSIGQEQEFLGPEFSQEEILKVLEDMKLKFHERNFPDLTDEVAAMLTEGKVVGWFQGRMEFGPRALGNRSILANPALKDMKITLNRKIKKREGFRPFAPVVLDRMFGDYFEDEGNDYRRMLHVTRIKNGIDSIPSCVHEDGSARVQILTRSFNERLYTLMERFYEKSGLPVLINTSFNERGEPMVNTPEDAIHCFLNTGMDVLVMENILVLKSENELVEFKAKKYALD